MEYSPETGGGGSGEVGAVIGVDLRVERLGGEEGVDVLGKWLWNERVGMLEF